MQREEWNQLLQNYRVAVNYLDSVVKHSRRLMGKEFEEEHQRIEEAKKACEKARRALGEYSARSGS